MQGGVPLGLPKVELRTEPAVLWVLYSWDWSARWEPPRAAALRDPPEGVGRRNPPVLSGASSREDSSWQGVDPPKYLSVSDRAPNSALLLR